jgi:hypothetical protein
VIDMEVIRDGNYVLQLMVEKVNLETREESSVWITLRRS